MSTEKDDDLKSFQIGYMSGAPGGAKKTESERFEVSKEDYPSLSNLSRSKATFKKKTNEKLESLKQVLNSNTVSSDEKERAEKAKKAWERALQIVSQVTVKD